MSFSHPRALQRFDIELPALVEIIDSDQTKICCYPMTRDLSGEGGFFQTTNPLAKNTRIKIGLIFEIGKLEPENVKGHFFLEFTGQVIRVEETGMAVLFDQNYLHIPVCVPPCLDISRC